MIILFLNWLILDRNFHTFVWTHLCIMLEWDDIINFFNNCQKIDKSIATVLHNIQTRKTFKFNFCLVDVNGVSYYGNYFLNFTYIHYL